MKIAVKINYIPDKYSTKQELKLNERMEYEQTQTHKIPDRNFQKQMKKLQLFIPEIHVKWYFQTIYG